MLEFEHRRKSANKGKRIELPENAIGVTVSTFSDYYAINYLVPVSDDAE